jgi:non-heme chloroperoxidase
MAYLSLSDETPIFYSDAGKGRPIVLLQGLMLSASYFWKKNAADISKTNRLVTYDHRSHGLSGKPLSGHTIKQCALDLKEILDALDLKDVTLGGVAFGAMVMFEYLRQFGAHRIAKLAVIEAQVRLTNAPGWDHPTFGNFPAEAGAGFVAGCRQSRAPLKGFLGGAFGKLPADDIMAEMQAETWLTPTGAVIEYIEDMLAADYRADVAKVPVPTVFMYGRNNNMTLPTELGRWMQSQLPGSKFVSFDQSGHSLFWEEPEKFSRELTQFVNG